MRLYAIFSPQPLTELTDVLKREPKAAEKCQINFKDFNECENKKLRNHYHYANNNCNLKYRMFDHIPIAIHNLTCYDAQVFIKELENKFNKDNIEGIAEIKEKDISWSKSTSGWQG